MLVSARSVRKSKMGLMGGSLMVSFIGMLGGVPVVLRGLFEMLGSRLVQLLEFLHDHDLPMFDAPLSNRRGSLRTVARDRGMPMTSRNPTPEIAWTGIRSLTVLYRRCASARLNTLLRERFVDTHGCRLMQASRSHVEAAG